jgi:hypothetical protein
MKSYLKVIAVAALIAAVGVFVVTPAEAWWGGWGGPWGGWGGPWGGWGGGWGGWGGPWGGGGGWPGWWW